MDVRKKVWVVAVVLLALTVAGVAEAGTKPVRSTTAKEKTKLKWYVVVRVRNMQGEMSFDVIEAKNLKDRVKQCYAQHKEALKKWNAARATAKKNKKQFTEKKPVEPYVRQMGRSRFKSEEKAREYAQKLQQQLEARKALKVGDEKEDE